MCPISLTIWDDITGQGNHQDECEETWELTFSSDINEDHLGNPQVVSLQALARWD